MNRFVQFAVAGGVAAAVNVAVRMVFNYFVPFETAVILAFGVAVTLAYFLNSRFVFLAREGDFSKRFGRFLIVNLVALAQVYCVSVLLARVLFPGVGFSFYPDTIAHVAGVLSPVITSYLLHKNYTFAK
jgi:putative flippase GtrA